MTNWTYAEYVNWLHKNRGRTAGAEPEPTPGNVPLAKTQRAGPDTKSRRVRFVSYRRRLLDRTNLEGGIKYFEDSLVYAGLIPGDAETQVTRTVAQVKVKTKAEERTEIELFYD